MCAEQLRLNLVLIINILRIIKLIPNYVAEWMPLLDLVEIIKCLLDWLKQLPGVGTKTANCVLLFSLGRPALPVDTHVFRVSKRLGLVDSRASVEQTHRLLESLVPSEDVYQFHLLLIEHGRRVCKAQRPRCHQCVLWEICPSYEIFMGKQNGREHG